ncbi:MAG: DUF4031 domain-containing protein [Pseudooceanicola sp.]|nr:DUF4031 domain-containing protein [Pseudooceanicola sp.]
MTVYVDTMRAPFRGMVMCHMVADTSEELLAMADRIGVARRWIQKAGTAHEHFDISLSKRQLAVAAGAVEIDRRRLAQLLRAKQHTISARKADTRPS